MQKVRRSQSQKHNNPRQLKLQIFNLQELALEVLKVSLLKTLMLKVNQGIAVWYPSMH